MSDPKDNNRRVERTLRAEIRLISCRERRSVIL